MPKIKTHKATAKRFKVTGSGKLRRRKGHASHLRRKKSRRAKRELERDLSVSEADRKRVRRILNLKRALKDDSPFPQGYFTYAGDERQVKGWLGSGLEIGLSTPFTGLERLWPARNWKRKGIQKSTM